MQTTNSGLYAAHLNVRPNETAAYEAMRDRLLPELGPQGAFEESFALHIINASWRIHRCDVAETAIPVLQTAEVLSDTVHDFAHPAQAAISRARAAAENTSRRTTRDLRELQAERWRRATLKLTGPIDPQELGLVPIKEAMSGIPTEAQRSHLLDRSLAIHSTDKPSIPEPATRLIPIAKGEHKATGRNSPCPCGSGYKYKRCCGSGSAPSYNLPGASGATIETPSIRKIA